MGENNSIKRKYMLTDTDLYSHGGYICGLLREDLTDLQDYGLSEEKITELEELLKEFSRNPFEKESVNDIKSLISEKGRIRLELVDKTRLMSLRVLLKWGRKSQQYKRLEIDYLTAKTDDELLICSRNVVSKMKEYLPQLLDYGLTQELIDELENLTADFEKINLDIADAKIQRKENTIKRIELGNQVYELLMLYMTIGKNYYYERNSARYKRYKITYYFRKKYKKHKNEGDETNDGVAETEEK